MYKFEVYQDKSGEFRFRFKASNGETMFSSEGYKAKASGAERDRDRSRRTLPVPRWSNCLRLTPRPEFRTAA